MRTLLIDNYDSFTWNLFQLLTEVNGIEPVVVKNDYPWEKVFLSVFDNIVISPGPGRPQEPQDFGISHEALKQEELPVLGVCLGHQGLCAFYGAEVVSAPEPCHGRVTPIVHSQTGLFTGIPSPCSVVRYHSLVVERVPKVLSVIARSQDGLVMAVKHETLPYWGVQFHPESICSEYGAQLLRNFANLTRDFQKERKKKIVKRKVSAGPARERYTILTEKFSLAIDSKQLFLTLFSQSETLVWLDSSQTGDRGRFSFMADTSGPLSEVIRYRIAEKTVTIQTSTKTEVTGTTGFFDYLKAQLKARKTSIPASLPFEFNLGYVGYLGYELKAECDGKAAHTSPFDDATLLFIDRMVVYDHQEQQCWLLCLLDDQNQQKSEHIQSAKTWFSTTKAAILAQPDVSEMRQCEGINAPPSTLHYRHDMPLYKEKILHCQEKIKAGESYEICLTNEVKLPYCGNDLHAYLALRKNSPVPFSAFLRFPGLSVLSASPERFLSISTLGVVESRPIKGTRRVDADPVVNQHLIDDLRMHEKDRAENLMIVDLVRNDLNRTCEPGTVHVPELFVVETFAHVHHLVSTIRGVLRPESSPIDCVRAAFPGGSMTGAPKIRTMAILDALEEGPRGIYSGSIGWFGLSGAISLNIVIRTLILSQQTASFGVGGAIIALSDPEEECEELRVKSRTPLSALKSEKKED